MSDSNSRLTHSTETRCTDGAKPALVWLKGDGIVRIQCQASGRKGKGVRLTSGIGADDVALNVLAAELKKKCDCGGMAKDDVIEIQGDERDLFKSLLEAKEMKVKLAGG